MRRLDAAIRKEEEEEAAVSAAAKEEADAGGVVDGEGNGEDKRKRKRRGDGEDVDNSESDAAKLEGMSYRELQALSKSRGLAANGSKKEVIERLLCAPSDTDGGVQDKKKIAKGFAGQLISHLTYHRRRLQFHPNNHSFGVFSCIFNWCRW